MAVGGFKALLVILLLERSRMWLGPGERPKRWRRGRRVRLVLDQ